MRVTPRPLTPEEQRVLSRILDAEFQGVEALRGQILGLRVVGRCDCGCPTIDLEPRPGHARSDQLGRRVAPIELLVNPEADEPPGGVILFIDHGKLSSLEYVYYSEVPPTEWPSDDRLSRIGFV